MEFPLGSNGLRNKVKTKICFDHGSALRHQSQLKIHEARAGFALSHSLSKQEEIKRRSKRLALI